jgi:GNAT superfamily N-acetyltransferase
MNQPTPMKAISTQALRIQKATGVDAEMLSKLAVESKSHWSYSREQIEKWRADLAVTPDDVDAGIAFIAYQCASPVGFYLIDIKSEEARLEHLWVKPQAIGGGVGTSLLSHALQQAAEKRFEELRIDADPRAEPFYLACGARREGEIPAPIQGEDDRARPQLGILTKGGGFSRPRASRTRNAAARSFDFELSADPESWKF